MGLGVELEDHAGPAGPGPQHTARDQRLGAARRYVEQAADELRFAVRREAMSATIVGEPISVKPAAGAAARR